MERNLSDRELNEWLSRLCDDGALEMIPGNDNEILVPLIMNDAAEVYCILRDVLIPGVLPEDLSEAVKIKPVSREGRKGLLVENASGIMTTIWYRDCLYREELYQYHRIMHCWMPGNEHMRMLVYMIGTMRDKYEYLGEGSCNEIEKSLMPLLEYRPFRYFSPIDQNLDAWYPDTRQGYQAVEEAAVAAGENELISLMRIGRLSGKLMDKRIAEQIAASRDLFGLIYKRICAASEGYAERCYGDAEEAMIRQKRKEAEKKLLSNGFKGSYPVYSKKEIQAVVFEEHPFTVPGMDDMEFDWHILLCDGRKKKDTYRIMEM